MQKVLLFAENDEKFREVWGEFLRRQGYRVRVAGNPRQARDFLTQLDIDLAILDFRLEDDDNPDDCSGLEVALEKSFRHIPKIILTAHTVSYASLRHLLGMQVDELPGAVAFVNKTEGPDALLRVIQQTLEVWPRLRISSIKVTEQIKSDHEAARKQAGINFRMSQAFSFFGFLVILLGVLLAWFNKLTIGIVGAATGLILEGLGFLFLSRLDRSNERMDTYHSELLQTFWFEYLLAACHNLPSEERIRYTGQALNAAIGSWLGSSDKTKITQVAKEDNPGS
jgi:CheY-like chemotaxis protein